MIKPDLDKIDARHEEAVLIGRKLDTDPLDEEDLVKLFACCSDVAELLTYVAVLEKGLTEAEAVIVRAQHALTVYDKVWWVLDDYDGSMDSVKDLKAVAEAARELMSKHTLPADMGTPEWFKLVASVKAYENRLGHALPRSE